jgi:hypothetical protein
MENIGIYDFKGKELHENQEIPENKNEYEKFMRTIKTKKMLMLEQERVRACG